MMKRVLASIRRTIVGTQPRWRRYALAAGLTVAYLAAVTFSTVEDNPFPTLLVIIGYALLVMFVTRTFRYFHAWLPGLLLLFFVLPFAGSGMLLVTGYVATNIALREARLSPDAEGESED